MNKKKPRTPCLMCGKEPADHTYKYCSNACQQGYQSQRLIAEWKSGKRSGLQRQGIVSTYVKKYLREKYGDKCCICGWNEINLITHKVPLVADHIDGDWQNNSEENLRLICPNCDSLSSTYAALNKGRGRKQRYPDQRAILARSITPLSRKAE